MKIKYYRYIKVSSKTFERKDLYSNKIQLNEQLCSKISFYIYFKFLIHTAQLFTVLKV